MPKQHLRYKITGLAVALAILFLLSFLFGRYPVSLQDVFGIFRSMLTGTPWTGDPNAVSAVLYIRLPRILLACLVGACLCAAGTAYQGVFQNPMAAPDLLGASSGAAFGAALAILMECSSHIITLFAFIFSLAAVFLAYLIGQHAKGRKVINLVLAGVMLSSLFSAGTSYIKLVADPTNQLPAITYWLMGSLSGTVLADVRFVLPPMLLGLIPLMMVRWRINYLTFGDEDAHALGINASRVRLLVIVCATLLTAASVSVSGMIGWVGLVVPHFCRRLVGNDYRSLLPTSLLAGAAFMLLTDNVSRNLLTTEIPIGILTAIVGAPFFIYLMLGEERFT